MKAKEALVNAIRELANQADKYGKADHLVGYFENEILRLANIPPETELDELLKPIIAPQPEAAELALLRRVAEAADKFMATPNRKTDKQLRVTLAAWKAGAK